MNIIEVKNNLVKLCYENDLKLSELIKITDNNKEFIAQVIHLEATRIGKTAIAKLIFNYNNGIAAYDGSIPSLKAEIQTVNTEILLKIIDKENPLNLGKIAQEQASLIVNIDILKDNPIICAEKYFTTKVLLNNIAMQLQARKSKIVVFDTIGVFKSSKMTLTKDFKLPLNSSTINYIYEKGFEDATAESKALIQSIFEELSEYSKTVEYIPFDTFKAVIDAEFKRTQLMQLIILKNKIKQIKDWNVFAESEEDYKSVRTGIENNQTLVIDISCVKEGLQKECIKYVYNILNTLNNETYVFTPLTNENSDKAMLQQINENENIHTITICGYDYKYLQELKQRSKNMLMFTPLKQQQDFGGYNIFLKKLAEDEFIAYGKMTKFVPLIAKLHNLTQAEIFIPKEIAEERTEIKQEPEKTEQTEITTETINETSTEDAQLVTESVENAENTDENSEPEETVVQEETKDEPTSEEEPKAEESEDAQTESDAELEAIAQEVPEQTSQEPAAEEPIITEEPVEEAPTVDEALAQVPEPAADEEELSDDDLDMIEQLSKPDEEIEVLNQEPAAEIESQDSTPESVPNEITQPTTETPAVEEQVQTPPDEKITEEPAAAIQEPLTEESATSKLQPESAEIVEEQPAEDTEEKKTENRVEEEINTATIPQNESQLQTRTNTNPIVPEYSADIPEEDKINSEKYKEGDRVMHQEFGEGVVEKMINYGDKLLCSINFTSVGRRLLNPEITEMTKI